MTDPVKPKTLEELDVAWDEFWESTTGLSTEDGERFNELIAAERARVDSERAKRDAEVLRFAAKWTGADRAVLEDLARRVAAGEEKVPHE